MGAKDSTRLQRIRIQGGFFPPKITQKVESLSEVVVGGGMFAAHTTFVHVDVVCPVQEPCRPVKTRHLHKSGIGPYSPPSPPCRAIPRNLCSYENITIQLKRKTVCHVSHTIGPYPAISMV